VELSIQNVPGEYTHYHLTPSCGLAKLCRSFGHPRFIPVKLNPTFTHPRFIPVKLNPTFTHPRFIPVKLNPTFTKAITDIVLQEIEEDTAHTTEGGVV